MSKLYPPIIEETLPAFYSENGIVKFTIPFSMNRAVSQSEIGGFELKIRAIQSGNQLYTVETYKPTDYAFEKNNTFVSFYIEDKDNKLKIGQFYKLQLAYINIDLNTKNYFLQQYYEGRITIEEFEIAMSQRKEVGYYSGAGVAKYTTKPKLYINNLREGFLNSYTNSYTGCYEQITSEENGYKDSTEKVYYYKFDFYDETGEQLLLTTDYQLHNTSLDTNIDYSQDIYNLNKDMKYNTIYYIQYSIITINGLTLSTPKYKLIQRELIDAQINVKIEAIQNVEEGYIDIKLIKQSNELGLYDLITGAFIILRSDEDSSYKEWSEVARFKLNEEIPPEEVMFRDFTCVQGKKYKYALQQYNDSGLLSNKIYSDVIQADFEYAFLYDGTHQLKIKYNSKMTKITNTHLEQKIDTIGSQFPFIFRNGNVSYYEFPIGGLISYFMDDEHLFMSEEELLMKDKTINYTIDNIAQERIFKIKVLEWLNNGQPKIFRSPTEGNFIIRLLKISMQPEQKLGRLLHNFSGTAYEIAEYNYENLCKYKFLVPTDSSDKLLQFATIDLSNKQTGIVVNTVHHELQSVRFDNMTPGEQILITFIDGSQETITIGITGSYLIDKSLPIESMVVIPRYERVRVLREIEFSNGVYYRLIKGKLIPGIELSQEMNPLEEYYRQINLDIFGLVTYSYFTTQMNTFGNINNVIINDCTIEQFIGEHNIIEEISTLQGSKNFIINPKRQITGYYSIIVRPRPIELFDQAEKDDYISFYKNNIIYNDRHPFTLYMAKGINTYHDFSNNAKSYNDYEPYVTINDEKILINTTMEIDLTKFDSITELRIGNGLIAEVCYQTKDIEYIVETTNNKLLENKAIYDNSIQIYNDYLEETEIDPKKLIRYRQDIKDNYISYIELLNTYI